MIVKCEKNNNLKIKNENGITILVLVVTIIIILIIAGISIWTLTGDKNIINQSMEARNQTVSKDIEEEVMQQWLLVQNDTKFEYPTNDEIAQKLQDRLSKSDSSVQVFCAFNNNFNVKYKGQSYKVNYNGIVESSLPIEFQQVEYIESTGKQWINTNLNSISKKVQIKMGFSISKEKEYHNLFCCRLNVTTSRTLFIKNLNGFRNDQNANQININQTLKLNAKYEIDSSQTYFKLDNNVLNEYDTNSGTNLDYPLYLLNCNNYDDYSTMSSIHGFEGKLYYCEIYDDTLKRNYIPCCSATSVTDANGIERPKGTTGMYDTVEGKFYTNQGTGTFLKGPEV